MEYKRLLDYMEYIGNNDFFDLDVALASINKIEINEHAKDRARNILSILHKEKNIKNCHFSNLLTLQIDEYPDGEYIVLDIMDRECLTKIEIVIFEDESSDYIKWSGLYKEIGYDNVIKVIKYLLM